MWGKKCKCLLVLTLLLMMAVPVGAYQMGDSGSQVLLIQQKLKKYGYRIAADGEYGPETSRAVQRFQADKGLHISGVVDAKTYLKLTGRKIPLINEDQRKFTKFAPQDLGSRIVASANKFIGVPYVFGGTTPQGFDCSGFTSYVFHSYGINLPRMADEQYRMGTYVPKQGLLPGDLVFFTTYEPGVSHAGIYVGHGDFISATTSGGIRIDSLSSNYWSTRYVGAKRIR